MEIDNILEEDLMAALDGLDMSDMSTVTLPSKDEIKPTTTESIEENILENSVETTPATSTSSQSIDASNLDVVSLLKELLNNKSLEITIRVKDN
jgi:hypothetical protein